MKKIYTLIFVQSVLRIETSGYQTYRYERLKYAKISQNKPKINGESEVQTKDFRKRRIMSDKT